MHRDNLSVTTAPPATTAGKRLQRLLQPRSIALVGGDACAEAIRQCRRLGYDGQLWPIHPRLAEIGGIAAYRNVAQLPHAPDAALIAVNRKATIEVLQTLALRGCGGAVCYAAGFAESGPEGRQLQRDLTAAAGDMPFLGPNCHGFINYVDGVALWPEQHGGERQQRGVALITQSGNIALNLTMQQRGLPVSHVLTLGNQARISLADAIEGLIEDPRVTAIGLHIEGIAEPEHFMRACARARARGVGLVALKTGSSSLGASLGLSHTASLAGADTVAAAFLRRAGIARVDSLPVLLETLKLLHLFGPLRGRDIAAMSCSGGEAGLLADVGLRHGVRFPLFDATQAQRIRATLPEIAHVTNPLDYHNFTWNDPAALEATYSAVLGAGFDLALLVLDFPRTDRCSAAGFDPALRAFASAATRTGARAAVVSTLPENLPEARARQLLAAGIVPLLGLEEALAAISAAAACGSTPLASAASAGVVRAPNGAPAQAWSEWTAKQALRGFGVSVPRGCKVDSPATAVAAAEGLGYPVVLKTLDASIAHKSELGALRLDLRDTAAVREAASQLQALHRTDLLIEEMVSEAVAELIVGIARDPVFGPYLVLGSGGVLVELVADRCTLLLPASEVEIRAALGSLRVAQLMRGYRGRPPGDIEATVAAIRAIQEFALAHRSRLLELDVNPLIVRAQGAGAVAADALVRMSEE
jgi:acetate---CoA ligase (ADP-forming)